MIGSIISWVFGVFFLLGGLAGLLAGDFIPAIAVLAIAGLLLPPVQMRIHKNTGQNLPLWMRALSIFILLIVAGVFAPQTKERPAASNDTEQAVQKQKAREQELTNKDTDSLKQDAEWDAHPYKIIGQDDFSFPARSRKRFYIVAPTAVTRESRIATAMDAAVRAHRNTWPDVVRVHLELSETLSSAPSLAIVQFAPDGCGLSGEDCTGEMWTDMSTSAKVATPQQIAIMEAWKNNTEKFNEADRLKNFLAIQFDVTAEEIEALRVNLLIFGNRKTVALPKHMKNKGTVTAEEKQIAEEKACQKDLQCWGDKKLFEATVACEDRIEKLGLYTHKWTDGWLEPKFSHFRWKSMNQGIVTYMGDKIQFQNGFGAWIPHRYWCDYDTQNKVVLDVRAEPGLMP